jgi:hypothetical protein
MHPNPERPMSTRKVTRYVEAKREYDCYMAQLARYPELKDSPTHCRSRTEAKALWLTLLRGLTGGEMAAAKSLEAQRRLHHPAKETLDA